MDARTAEPTALQRRGMRAVMLAQTFGSLGLQAFSNGVLLLFLAKQGFSGASALLLLSVPSLVQPTLLLALAHHADQHGRARMAVRGATINTLGFAMICGSGLLEGDAGAALTVIGIVVFSL